MLAAAAMGPWLQQSPYAVLRFEVTAYMVTARHRSRVRGTYAAHAMNTRESLLQYLSLDIIILATEIINR